MSRDDRRSCPDCGAGAAVPCSWSCEELADRAVRAAVTAGAADAVLARAFTVEASKLYARLSHPSRGPLRLHRRADGTS